MVGVRWGYLALKSLVKLFEKSYGKCPQCGGKLVMRNGKYGRFIGCSGYPKCKYTQNI